MVADGQHFSAEYYQRYYLDGATRVADPKYFKRLASFIGAYARLLDLKIGSIVDLGCGTGTLKKPLLGEFSRVTYAGVELSAYACERYGWQQACASTYETDSAIDLLICHDVLQYLDDELAASALRNFAALTGQLLYFSVLTKEDWQLHVDQHLTDGDVFLREANWYRKRLKNAFKNLGGGMYLARGSEAVVYALESGL
ncbi:MAG: class I SAM-dependent methyltransferase [Pseudomonadota bacterium]